MTNRLSTANWQKLLTPEIVRIPPVIQSVTVPSPVGIFPAGQISLANCAVVGRCWAFVVGYCSLRRSMNTQYAYIGAAVVGWAAICVLDLRLPEQLLPVAVIGCLCVVLEVSKRMSELRSELEQTKFQLDTEVESSAILAKELELMLAKGQDSSPKERIGAYWNRSAAASARVDETKEEKEQRVAEYLEDVGGIVVSETDLRRWVGAADRLKKAEADMDMTRALLSESLRNGGKNKTEAINEVLFILSKDVI